MKRVYLDYASAAPLEKGAYKAMRPFMQKHFGNPGAQHTEGRYAKEVLENARKDIAKVVGVRKEEVIFTSGATEANTLAILGHVEALKKEGKTYKDMHLITSSIEHVNILRTAHALKEKGAHITFVDPNEHGLIDPKAIKAALTDKTVLVSIQYVNSEIGTIMPLRAIKSILPESVMLHTDAAQAAYFLPVLQEKLQTDLMVLDAQKFGGPRGVGVLIRKRHVPLSSLLHGGGQEGGIRPGTEVVSLAVGCAYALAEAQEKYSAQAATTTTIRDFTIEELLKIPGVVLNGSQKDRIANNINISLPGKDSEYLAVLLDKDRFAVSTKITCDTGVASGSDVVRIISQDEKRALSTLRITLGPSTTKRDMQRFIQALKKNIAFLDAHSI